jgi:DNA-binding MltR family transcriptional regulator
MARTPLQPKQAAKDLGYFFKVLTPEESPALYLVLVGAAALEQAIMSLLQAFFIEGETSKGVFKEGGLLGEFSGCFQLAYCLGLIDKWTYQNAMAVARIRNTFAHSHKELDFKDDKIVALCNELKEPLDGLMPQINVDAVRGSMSCSARTRFEVVLVAMTTGIIVKAGGVKRVGKCDSIYLQEQESPSASPAQDDPPRTAPSAGQS